MSDQVREEPIRIDPGYLPPLGTPLYWRDEQSGVLRGAIHAFIGYSAGERDLPTFKRVAYTVGYLRYVIDAPCWRGEGLEALRARAGQIASSPKRIVLKEWCAEINQWLMDCLEIGIDPL